jgi:hypothetical protein
MKSKISKSQYQKMLDSHDWYYMMKSFQYSLKNDIENETNLKKIGEENGWIEMFNQKIDERSKAISSEL